MVGVSDLFPGWADGGELGSGSYGSVRLATKEVGGVALRRAVKLVPVPHDRAEAEAVRRATGKDDESLRSYFEHYAQSMMVEVAAMEGLRACPQVVTVDDCQMVPDPDSVGWVVGIMMELLEPVDALMGAGPAGQAEVARLGADVARALEACHALGIVHRDVKPSNVLTNGRGVYKLGDFGIARVLSEGTTGELSRRGTPSYMAPEEVRGEGYGASVDVYALGVMLYRMLNGGRQPFLEVDPLNATPRDLQRAEMRRLSGERFPEIVGVDPSLMSMVLRMCETDPSKRPSPTEVCAELEACVVALAHTIPASKAARQKRPAAKGKAKEQLAADAEDVMLPGGTVKRPTPVPAPSRSDATADGSTVLGPDGARINEWASVPTEPLDGGDTWRVEQESAPTEPRDATETLVDRRMPNKRATGQTGGHKDAQTPQPKGTSAKGTQAAQPESASRKATKTSQPKLGGGKVLIAAVALFALVVMAVSSRGILNALQGDGSTSTASDVAAPAVETKQESQPEHNESAVDTTVLQDIASTWSVYSEDDESSYFVAVSAGREHAIFLRSDGTALAVGRNPKGQCDVSGWTNVVAVSAGDVHTVGLRSDGTVLAAGDNEEGECDVSSWTDVVAVATGYQRTLGLRSDGTVLTAGNFDDDYDFSDWTDIVAIAAGDHHMVGLRSDGTVVATGSKYFDRKEVSDWSDVVAISAGLYTTVGLRSDGTVLATGPNTYGECDVSGWTDIVEVAAGGFHTVGLRSDGTVVATGSNDGGRSDVSGWTDVAHVAAGTLDTVAVRSDGSILQCGPGSKYYHFTSE